MDRVGAGAVQSVAVVRCDAFTFRATDCFLDCEKGREIYHFSRPKGEEGFLPQVGL